MTEKDGAEEREGEDQPGELQTEGSETVREDHTKEPTAEAPGGDQGRA